MKIINLAIALMSLFTTILASSGSRPAICKEDTLKCGGGNPGGAVFVCRKGRWEVLINCGASESCVSDPIATCTWAKGFVGSIDEATGAITGFEISPEEVSVAIKFATASTKPADNKDADDTAPYFNICSPCITHNDYCRATECDWQGSKCDQHCNQRTCSVNLTTGDWRQPTVSCGHFCKWPCH